LEVDDGLLRLDPAARVQVVVDGLEQEIPVFLDKRQQITAMDVVELVAEYPVIVHVINLKTAVGW
jgi:hypothetical protein